MASDPMGVPLEERIMPEEDSSPLVSKGKEKAAPAGSVAIDVVDEPGGLTLQQTVYGSFKNKLKDQAKKTMEDIKRKKSAEMERIQQIKMKTRRTCVEGILYRDDFIACFLVLLGFVCSSIGIAIDAGLDKMREAHHYIGTEMTDYWFVNLPVYVIAAVSVAMLGLVITKYVTNNTAAGSGLPEMKAILSGVLLNEYLSFRTMVGKILGIYCVVGSGFFLGKEGPFVHLAAIIANQLLRLRPFRTLYENEPLRQQLLAAACATGVASNFGAPIGGTLFSIEVTSTYFPTRNYWYSFVTGVAGGFFYRVWYNIYFKGTPDRLAPIFSHGRDYIPQYDWLDIFMCCMVGVISGLTGALFIKLGHTILEYKHLKWFQQRKWTLTPWAYAAFFATITAIVAFPGFFPFFWTQYGEMYELYTQRELSETWTKFNVIFSTGFFFVVRVVLTSGSKAIAAPGGLIVALLTTGAGLGRFVGEIMKRIYGSDPIIYTLVGSACFAGGVTHTISSFVFVMEITGLNNLLFPFFMSVMIAVRVSGAFTLNVYDASLKEKGLPYLPDLKNTNYSTTAAEIMKTNVEVLVRDATPQRILEMLETTDYSVFPVVDSLEGRFLVGSCTRKKLEQYLFEYFSTLQPVESYVGDDEGLSLSLGKRKKKKKKHKLPSKEEGKTNADIVKELRVMAVAAGVLDEGPKPIEQSISLSSGSLMAAASATTTTHQLPDFIVKKLPTLPIEPAPIQALPTTPLTQIHLLFITFRLSHMFVTDHGRIAGLITRKDLKHLAYNFFPFSAD